MNPTRPVENLCGLDPLQAEGYGAGPQKREGQPRKTSPLCHLRHSPSGDDDSEMLSRGLVVPDRLRLAKINRSERELLAAHTQRTDLCAGNAAEHPGGRAWTVRHDTIILPLHQRRR